MSKPTSNSPQTDIPLIERRDQLAAAARELGRQDVIAFDTEFLWERTYSPRLGLIQVADLERTWLVDPLALSKRDMQPLLDVLTSPRTLKVAHAVDQDQICLHQAYGVVAEPVLDTAVGAALTGMGDQIGLSKLLHSLLRIDIDKGHSRTNWLKRPLPPKMVEYAAADVSHLTKAANVLQQKLVRLGREEWAMDLSRQLGEFAKAQFTPGPVARKLAEGKRLDPTTFAVLEKLVEWREREAQRIDIPRRWLAEDKMLIKLATARPVEFEQLADFRGLGLSKRPQSSKRLLQAIRSGTNSPADDYVRPQIKRGATAKESAALVVLKCFLNALAADHKVPLRLLISNGSQLDLLRNSFDDVKALADSGILEPRAVALVGEELVEILDGRRGLRLVNGVATQVKA